MSDRVIALTLLQALAPALAQARLNSAMQQFGQISGGKADFSNGPGDVKSPGGGRLPVQQVSRLMVISSVSDLIG